MNKINNDHSLHGNIPFSWENRPGVRKENLAGELSKERRTTMDNVNLSVVKEGIESKPSALPPPPCENSNYKVISNDIGGLPLPPCVFQPHLRSSSRRSSKDDDPFLLAYKECTKTNKKSNTFMRNNSFRGRSCKYSCSVRDDSIVRVSHIPMSSNSDGKVKIPRG